MPQMIKSNINKKKKFLLSCVFLLLLVYSVQGVMYHFFSKKQSDVFANRKKPLVIAHQGGELLAPADTLAAFEKAHRLNVDVLELDIHMTKDGHLVTIHDDTVDRTTNGKGRVDELSLKELQRLDAGYRFKDLKGEYSFRGKGVYIPTLDEVFSKYGKDHYFNIEIKDAYPLKGKSQIEHKLWQLIQKHKLEKKVVVTSFEDDIVDRFIEESKGETGIGASLAEVAQFVILNQLWLDGLYRPSAHVIQIPIEYSGMNLKDKSLIDAAHRLNMQVHYWTIDDKKTMKELIQLGADGIITNRPDLLKEVVSEMKLK
ncbi:glycerophosphodiester phosphodiesterase [Thermoflavimicrobium daqui]|uniref:Glycerophosphodiester phosphodiesterase n=1 Tax=Thermoflavimicrobium daqui TaxID=2137476 RepID=A0A364K2G7_9BACL|nr:glycerophosphodiester phosphodiesterase [Thermoflavimicrobium daqui]RAL22499.1 glycerophosphodiester phosphodiesterase [Thermoflavimicrobium daqui]